MASRTKIVETSAPKTLAEAVALVEDPGALLLAIVDRAIRDARDNNWCDSFESIMERVAPELAVPVAYDRREYGAGTSWIDSDGITCSGHDVDGFKNGFHYNTGLDREGYNSDGFHHETGLDRAGFDRFGDNPNDPTSRYRYALTRTTMPALRDRQYYLTDWDGFQSNGGPAYNGYGNYLTRHDLATLRAQGDGVFKYDRGGNEAPASE